MLRQFRRWLHLWSCPACRVLPRETTHWITETGEEFFTGPPGINYSEAMAKLFLKVNDA